jgi:hypothetical protein
VAYCRIERGEARAPCPDCYGGGIYSDSSILLIEHNLIQYCEGSAGGGIFVGYADGVIRENEIRFCDAGGGGGICAFHGSPRIESNVLESDSAWTGGGICLYSSSSPVLGNRVLECFAESRGGGLFVQNSDPLVELNEIIGNHAEVAGGGVAVNDSLSPTLRANTIQGNSSHGLFQENDAYPVDAIENYWGHPSGPYHPTLNPSGLGDTVSDHVEFIPWAIEPGVKESPMESVSPHPPTPRLVPNPVRSGHELRLILDLHGSTPGDVSVRIVDPTGRVRLSLEPSRKTDIVPLDPGPDLEPGVYFVIVGFEDGRRTIRSKLVLLP